MRFLRKRSAAASSGCLPSLRMRLLPAPPCTPSCGLATSAAGTRGYRKEGRLGGHARECNNSCSWPVWQYSTPEAPPPACHLTIPPPRHPGAASASPFRPTCSTWLCGSRRRCAGRRRSRHSHRSVPGLAHRPLQCAREAPWQPLGGRHQDHHAAEPAQLPAGEPAARGCPQCHQSSCGWEAVGCLRGAGCWLVARTRAQQNRR